MCTHASEVLQSKERTLDEGLAEVRRIVSWLHRPDHAEDDSIWEHLWQETQVLFKEVGSGDIPLHKQAGVMGSMLTPILYAAGHIHPYM